MSESRPARTDPRTPFERFTEFTRRVIAIPKSEVQKKAREYRRRRQRKRSKKSN